MLNFIDGCCAEANKAELPLNSENVLFLFPLKKNIKKISTHTQMEVKKLYTRAHVSAK